MKLLNYTADNSNKQLVQVKPTFQTEFKDGEVTSKDIFNIYKEIYNFAVKLNDSIWTESTYNQLHLRFTNPGVSRKGNDKRKALCRLSLEVNNYFEGLFRKLQYSQEND